MEGRGAVMQMQKRHDFVGPPAFRDFLRSVHLDLAAQSIASGDSSVEANSVYAKFLSTVQAIVARGNYMTVDQHTPPFA